MDLIKTAKRSLKWKAMSPNCKPLVNKMHLEVQYLSVSFVDQDGEKGVVVSMIVLYF